jgi:hypothetical protein
LIEDRQKPDETSNPVATIDRECDSGEHDVGLVPHMFERMHPSFAGAIY